jgi:hypothetical protein
LSIASITFASQVPPSHAPTQLVSLCHIFSYAFEAVDVLIFSDHALHRLKQATDVYV